MRYKDYTPAPVQSVLWRAAVILIAVLLLAAIPAYIVVLPQPPVAYVVQCSPGAGLEEHYIGFHASRDTAEEDVYDRVARPDYAACSIIPTVPDSEIPNPGE